MHDVLVHYLEVNFPEIAEQLAHARAGEPSNEERAAAAERLRELIRRLRRGAVESGAAWHEPRAHAEAFNIANHANFRLPNINIGVPAGGAITNTLTGFGRQLQLVAKIVF